MYSHLCITLTITTLYNRFYVLTCFYTDELDVHVTPNAAPCPVRTFRQANFDTKLLNEILAVGYETPTAIQAQAIPVAMSGYDVIGLAKTGIVPTVSISLYACHFVVVCIICTSPAM